MKLHGIYAHDVGHLASVPRVVILRFRDDRQHALGEAALGAILRGDLLVVPVPDDLRGRISAPRSASQLELLSTFHCLPFGVSLDVRLARRVWKLFNHASLE